MSIIKVKREFSAGGVVFKKERKRTLWLICKPSGKDKFYQKGWRFPKGWIEENETSQQAALREVKEEGGVAAEIVDKIGTIKFFFYNKKKEKVFKSVVFYLMKWIGDFREGAGWETEKVEWLPYQQAYKKLAFVSEKEILIKAKRILERSEA